MQAAYRVWLARNLRKRTGGSAGSPGVEVDISETLGQSCNAGSVQLSRVLVRECTDHRDEDDARTAAGAHFITLGEQSHLGSP